MRKDDRISLSDVYADLKSMTFNSKMVWAYRQSLSIMNPFSTEIKEVTPDEIETFVMLSIKSKENNCKEMTINEYQIEMKKIMSFRHPAFDKIPQEERVKWIFLTRVSSQIIHQMDPYHLINRYIYYFTYNKKINMNAEFFQKFNIDYIDVIGPISLLWFSLNPDSIIELTLEGYNWLCKKYKKSFEILTISRELYTQQLENITKNIDDYRFCLRPSFQTPYISFEGKNYLPTPHLLIISATTSLMYRLTEGNSRLRQEIGKHVLESYLYKIINDNSEFDEVLPEQTYDGSQKTLDVLSRIGDDIICFDSKSFSPSIGVKVFSDEALKHIEDVLAENICQAYKHIHDKFGVKYSYLSVPVRDDKSNIYAIVVIAEEPYIIREEVYSVAAGKLGIQIPSPEYDWLRGHIGITELSVLEKQLFDKRGIIDAVKRNSKTRQYSDFWFFDGKVYDHENEDFEKTLYGLWTPIIEEAKKDSIVLCNVLCE